MSDRKPMKIEAHRDEYLKADAEEKAALLAKVYGVPKHMLWKHGQSGRWIISHAGVEMIAAQERITVSYVEVSMTPEFVVIHGTPHRDCLTGQGTYGEASPKNTTQKHPVAMAEKRTYDRAVLKMVLASVGGYGADFYSEEEADDFRKPAGDDPAPKQRKRGVTIATNVEDFCARLAEVQDPAAVMPILDEIGRLDGAADKDWFKKYVKLFADAVKAIQEAGDIATLKAAVADHTRTFANKAKDDKAQHVLAAIKAKGNERYKQIMGEAV